MDNFHRKVLNIEVTDGDTFRAEVDLGFGQLWRRRGRKSKPKFRILDINCPETTRRGSWDNGLGDDQVEKLLDLGAYAKDRLKQLVEDPAAITWIHCPEWDEDSLGRILAHLYVLSPRAGHLAAVSIAPLFIREGLAVPYGEDVAKLIGVERGKL